MTHDVAIHVHRPDPPAVNPQTFNSPWRDPAVVERVTALWTTHSSTQIAQQIHKEFGVALTRNQVVGKVARLGLTSEHKTELEPRTVRKRRSGIPSRPKVHRPKLRIVANGGGGLRVMQSFKTDQFDARVVDITPRNLSLDDLTDDTCRWPEGDGPEFTFCGHKPLGCHPYCAAHCGIAYRPYEDRRRA